MTGAAQPLPAADGARILDELGRDGAPLPGPKPFRLGRERPTGTDKLRGLERMGERIARALRPLFESLAQARTEVAVEPLAIQRWDDYSAALPGFTSLSGYRLRPLKGGMVIAIPPAFVTALLERFYGGGSGEAPSKAAREFTAGEDLLLGRLLERLVPVLVDHWGEVAPVTAQLAERDTAPGHFQFLRGDEAIVVQRFRIAPLECQSATIAVVYPLAMLRSIEEQLALRVHDEPPGDDPSWRGRLAAALAEVSLPVRSVLARPEITLGQLMALKPGDVIPIQLGARTPLLVANQPIAEGQIGERDGRAALMIDQFKRS